MLERRNFLGALAGASLGVLSEGIVQPTLRERKARDRLAELG